MLHSCARPGGRRGTAVHVPTVLKPLVEITLKAPDFLSVEGPADLVVEVASAGTRSYDMGEKAGV